MNATRIATTVLLGLLALASPQRATADDPAAAMDRSAKLLAGLAAIRPELCADQLLGVFLNGKLVGFMRVNLAASADATKPAYDFELTAEMKVGDTMRMSRVLAGQIGPNLAPLQADGEQREQNGPQRSEETYGFAVADGGLSWTAAKTGAPEKTQLVAGAVDSLSGVTFLLSRLWVSLPEAQPHRLRLFSVAKGQIEVVEIVRSPVQKRTVDGVERAVIEVASHEPDDKAAGVDAMVLDATTGQILAFQPGDAPVNLRPITTAQLAQWTKGEPVAAPAPIGPPAGAPPPTPPVEPVPPTPLPPAAAPLVDVVAAFFEAIARQDKAALIGAIEPRTFIVNTGLTTAPDEAARERMLADLEGRWKADPKAFVDEFVAGVFASVDPTSMPKDAAAYRPFLSATAPTDSAGEVQFRNGGVTITFKLALIDGRWRIIEQRQH